ncbi:MAG: aldo/keto reductase [Acidobacteriota bacterium]|nr:MAG: aldo/keto reductase [Acidobacteriota bacterium]
MKQRLIGKSGISASAVSLGAWAIGGWLWGGQDDDQSIRAIQASIDSGINFIDTAPIYGFGRSEEIVGKAIRGRRDEVIIATKCGLRWQKDFPKQGNYHFSSDEAGIQQRGSDGALYDVYRFLGPESIRWEVEQSLRRLQIETIDLYQTHWQEETTPIEDTMATLLELKAEGKIRSIGVSNAKVHHMEKYRSVGQLDADQEKYSMLDRKLESGSLPYCRKHDVAMLAYSPLANGLLTGKIGPDREFGAGDLRTWNKRFTVENRRKVASLLRELEPIAESYQLTLAQLVIAWTIAQPGVTHALVGIRNEAQAKANAKAGVVDLSDTDLVTIEKALASQGNAIV